MRAAPIAARNAPYGISTDRARSHAEHRPSGVYAPAAAPAPSESLGMEAMELEV